MPNKTPNAEDYSERSVENLDLGTNYEYEEFPSVTFKEEKLFYTKFTYSNIEKDASSNGSYLRPPFS